MNRLLTSVMVGLAGIQGISLAAESRPKLVVGIMVDQLRTDYLEDLKDMFSAGGFRRLMENGVYFKDIDFVVEDGDAASRAAIVQTGTYPRFNGVTASKIYDTSTKSFSPVFIDKNYIGNFTDETYSPSALKVTTLTDEIAAAGKGNAKIHSITPDAAESIVLAGHSANSSFWINDDTGRWATTTYYPYPPTILQNINYNNPLIARLDTMKWIPLHKGEPYPYVSSQEIKDGFRYSFSRSDRDVFKYYKDSPYVNKDIAQAAAEYISELNLGKGDETTDVLNLGFTLTPYTAGNASDYRYSLQDAYLRLDKDLESLFNTLDRQVGKENVLIYLVSSGYFEEPKIDKETYRIPGGTFSVKRSMSLLNAYLSAKYGNGAFVDQYFDNHIFLAENVIEEKNLDIKEVASDARDFLIKMSGISDAYTISDLASPSLPQMEGKRLAIDPKASGNIIIEFNPGWEVIDDSRYPPVTKIDKTMVYPAPGFILGTGIVPKIIEETVEAVTIAPTIAQILRIRSPNSSISKPFSLAKDR